MDAKAWNGEPDAEHDPNTGGAGIPYICTECPWTGRGVTALEHHVNTGHAVRGRRWPKTWPNAIFAGVERRQTQRTA
jgi:hypothetical protein